MNIENDMTTGGYSKETMERAEEWTQYAKLSLSQHLIEFFRSIKLRKFKGEQDFLTFHCWRISNIWKTKWDTFQSHRAVKNATWLWFK